MKPIRNTHTTTLHRITAYVLLISQLLTSCGGHETILPRSAAAAPTPLQAVVLVEEIPLVYQGGQKIAIIYTAPQGKRIENWKEVCEAKPTRIEIEAERFKKGEALNVTPAFTKSYHKLQHPTEDCERLVIYITIPDSAANKSPFIRRSDTLLKVDGHIAVSLEEDVSFPAASPNVSPVSTIQMDQQRSGGRPKSTFKLENVAQVEVEEVQAQYMRSPVQGYEIATIEKIVNRTMQQAYDSHGDLLDERQESVVFTAKWDKDSYPEQRQGVHDKLLRYVATDKLTVNPRGVKELKLWHGTKECVASSIFKTGFANLATTDKGFYGKGLYFTPQASYAYGEYGKGGDGILILSKVCFYSAYPVVSENDMVVIDPQTGAPVFNLTGAGNYGNYDAHFIPINPKSPAALEERFRDAIDPHKWKKEYYLPSNGIPSQYDEFVVFEKSAILPMYLIRLQPGIPSSPSLMDQFKTLELLPLTIEKLKNPSKGLTIDESLLVLSNCLDIGERQAEEARDKEIVIFIGNTGAGKSTAINYLTGCEMERISKKKAGLEGTGKIVQVKEGSAIPSLMKIGHAKVSETFLPDIHSDEHFTYCDCPGFLDNRGAEVNIANAVNIRKAIELAKSVKVNVLINYNSLQADRGRGISETKRILSDLFGTEERLQENLESILIGITQVPPPTSSEDDDSDDQMNMGQLRADFKTDALLYANAQRIITFDPCNKPIKGGLTRAAWIAQIQSLPSIQNPSDIFKSVLMLSDERKLRDIAKVINERILSSLEEKAYERVKEYLLTFNKLDRIGHDYVKGLKAESTQHIINQIHNTRHQIILFMMQDDFDSAKKILADLYKMKESLSVITSCEFVNNGYQEAKRYVEHGEKRYKEQQEQTKQLASMLDEQAKLHVALKQLQDRESASFKLQTRLEEDFQQTKAEYQQKVQSLEAERDLALSKIKQEQTYATEEQKQELAKELTKQEVDYKKRLSAIQINQQVLESNHQSALDKVLEQKNMLEKEKTALQAREESLQTGTQKVRGKQNLIELKRLLNKQYLGESVWKRLGVEVNEDSLPYVSDELLTQIRVMKTQGGQPIVFLALGYSIKELEEMYIRTQSGMFRKVKLFHDDKHEQTIKQAACYTEKLPSQPYWVLINGLDHGIVPGTRNKSYQEQVNYQQDHYPDYKIGSALELIQVIILQHLQDSNAYLCANKPITYGRVIDQYQVTGPQATKVVFGNFTQEGGIYLHKDQYLIVDKNRGNEYGLFGVVGRYL